MDREKASMEDVNGRAGIRPCRFIYITVLSIVLLLFASASPYADNRILNKWIAGNWAADNWILGGGDLWPVLFSDHGGSLSNPLCGAEGRSHSAAARKL